MIYKQDYVAKKNRIIEIYVQYDKIIGSKI